MIRFHIKINYKVFKITFCILSIIFVLGSFYFGSFADDFTDVTNDTIIDTVAEFDYMIVDDSRGHYVIGNPFRIFTNGQTALDGANGLYISVDHEFESQNGQGVLSYDQTYENGYVVLHNRVVPGTYHYTFIANNVLVDSTKIEEFARSFAIQADASNWSGVNSVTYDVTFDAVAYSSCVNILKEYYPMKESFNYAPANYCFGFTSYNNQIHGSLTSTKTSANQIVYLFPNNKVNDLVDSRPKMYYCDDMYYRTGEYAYFVPDTLCYLRLGNYKVDFTVTIDADSFVDLYIIGQSRAPMSGEIRISDSFYGYPVGSIVSSELMRDGLSLVNSLFEPAGAFFDIELVPGFSLGVIGVACMGVVVATIVLKFFVGG